MLCVITPAESLDLTTLDAAKAELGVSDGAADMAIGRLIAQASAAIVSHTGHVWGKETVEQIERPNRPRAAIVLDRTLAPAVSVVAVDGVALVAEEWELDGSLLYRLSGDRRVAWCAGKVAVTYQAGYDLPSAVPGDVERACLLTVSAWHSARGRDPLLRSDSTEGVGASSWVATETSGGLPPQAIALLADGGHCRISVG